jgi:hypothetical protein
MRLRMTFAAAIFGLLTSLHAAAAQEVTPAGPVPEQPNEARNRVQNWLHATISRMPDAALIRTGIAASDVGRVKACVVQAVVADIPDEPARRIADAVATEPPQKEDAVVDWIFASFEKSGERRRQVQEQMLKLCPEFKDAFGS